MERVVGAAAQLARPGDTVLLAPGCASMDKFAELRRAGRRVRRGGAGQVERDDVAGRGGDVR